MGGAWVLRAAAGCCIRFQGKSPSPRVRGKTVCATRSAPAPAPCPGTEEGAGAPGTGKGNCKLFSWKELKILLQILVYKPGTNKESTLGDQGSPGTVVSLSDFQHADPEQPQQRGGVTGRGGGLGSLSAAIYSSSRDFSQASLPWSPPAQEASLKKVLVLNQFCLILAPHPPFLKWRCYLTQGKTIPGRCRSLIYVEIYF